MTHDIAQQIDKLTLEIEATPTADLYFRRGKLYWKSGDKPQAITDFNHAVQLDCESPAAVYLAMSTDIMDFYNTDLYNP